MVLSRVQGFPRAMGGARRDVGLATDGLAVNRSAATGPGRVRPAQQTGGDLPRSGRQAASLSASGRTSQRVLGECPTTGVLCASAGGYPQGLGLLRAQQAVRQSMQAVLVVSYA